MKGDEDMDADNDYMLTTYDNPFNPFTQFEAWFKFDAAILGYNTCALLAKTANVSDVVSDEIANEEIDFAMNELIRRNPTIYKKVLRSDYPSNNLQGVGGSA